MRLMRGGHEYILNLRGEREGVIAPGRYADMVVLAEDIVSVPTERLDELQLLLTMVGGKVVYRANDFDKVARR
jgi:predicted amidohydrolase YtcJ